ncbi:molybdenum cofactor guanylyltransferase [Actinomycetes bacterium KLBMP 9759]
MGIGAAETAGIVVAGGRSSRMGTAKAGLAWHGSTLLYRTAALLRRTVGGPVLVVGAPGQLLPQLPHDVELVADPVEGLGPMQGLAVGLTAVGDQWPAAFVCSTDMPFLHPAFVRRVLRGFAEVDPPPDIVLPVTGGFRQPLAAAYRTSLALPVTRLLAAGNLRPGMLYEHCAVARLDDAALLRDAELARLDPALDSVVNVNTTDDYAAALARPAPDVLVGGQHVRAATLAEAAAAAGFTLDATSAVTLNGDQVPADPRLPLVAGDAVDWPGRLS